MTYDARESSRHSGTSITLFLMRGAQDTGYGPFAFCNGETPFVRDGITYTPWPIKHGKISQSGGLDNTELEVSMAAGSALDALFIAYPPSQVINISIFEGHIGDAPTNENFPAIWVGRINSASYSGNETQLVCTPVSTSIRRPGLRRNYQVGCPHALYGEQCKASKAAATITATVSGISGREVTITTIPTNLGRYAGGLLEWVDPATGWTEIRTIAKTKSAAGKATFTIRGIVKGLTAGMTLSVVRGCNRQMTGCITHSNILNYGGQPLIPLENPLSQKNQFY